MMITYRFTSDSQRALYWVTFILGALVIGNMMNSIWLQFSHLHHPLNGPTATSMILLVLLAIAGWHTLIIEFLGLKRKQP